MRAKTIIWGKYSRKNKNQKLKKYDDKHPQIENMLDLKCEESAKTRIKKKR